MNEPLDRNKTSLTHVATATAAAWLSGLGCKPVETEVPIDGGWIADLATFWSPTLSEARRSRLLRDLCPDAIHKDSYFALAELSRSVGGRLTIAVEVKVSRADFVKDLGRKYCLDRHDAPRPSLRPPAHFILIAAPKDVIRDRELSSDYGHLCLSQDCSRVVKWKGPWHAFGLLPHQIEDLIAAVAIRRDNVTRYAAARRFWKHYRARQAERRSSGGGHA